MSIGPALDLVIDFSHLNHRKPKERFAFCSNNCQSLVFKATQRFGRKREKSNVAQNLDMVEGSKSLPVSISSFFLHILNWKSF